ncbi:MAG: hypothetical protein IKL10_09215 [Clostridia bacterium]|nr:hypothetical protein [Clostridia bacterium]
MAEYCPKCNYKLKITDWRPECPKCGVNVMYYGIEDRLREEADRAELQHAKSQPRYDRLKFSLIGHPLSIVRIVLGLLPIVATLLPMGTVNYILPYLEKHATVNLISIVTFIIDNGFDVDLILKLLGSDIVGTAMIFWAVSLVCLVLMVVLTLVGFFLLTMSCSKRGFQRNIAFPTLGIIFSTASFICYILMINNLSAALPGIFTGSVNPAAYIVAVVLFVAMIVVNVIYKKKNIPVKYKDVSEYLLPYNERPSTIAKKTAEKEANA